MEIKSFFIPVDNEFLLNGLVGGTGEPCELLRLVPSSFLQRAPKMLTCLDNYNSLDPAQL